MRKKCMYSENTIVILAITLLCGLLALNQQLNQYH